MSEPGAYAWANPWFRWSVVWLVVLTALCVLVGFVWLPSVHGDFTAQGLWASICRAAGVPAKWSATGAAKSGSTSTNVVLERVMARPGAQDSIGRGATLALNCTMCHGAQGMSRSDAPNLAGQYPEVVIKQLHDYKSGKRAHEVMAPIAQALEEQQIVDVAAHFAAANRLSLDPTTAEVPDPDINRLVERGDPARKLPACNSCHGFNAGGPIETPTLSHQNKEYLARQLRAFRDGGRRNDIYTRMRSVAEKLSDREVERLATFYATTLSY